MVEDHHGPQLMEGIIQLEFWSAQINAWVRVVPQDADIQQIEGLLQIWPSQLPLLEKLQK